MYEEWAVIREFPAYLVSTRGRIMRKDTRNERTLSRTQYGDIRISFKVDGVVYNRSVKMLVAETWIPRPNELFDSVIILDNVKDNLRIENLAWRPNWFAWKYARQFNANRVMGYSSRPVMNVETGVPYESIIDAAIANGELFVDILRSIHGAGHIFPHRNEYTWY